MNTTIKALMIFGLCLKIYALEQSYFLAQTHEVPKRDVSIIASANGFYPKRPVAFVGEKISLYVTSTTDRPSCLIVKGRDVYLEAQRGEVSIAQVYFKSSGIYEFFCPASGHKGEFVILEHPRDKRERINRELASKADKKVKVWRPKDE